MTKVFVSYSNSDFNLERDRLRLRNLVQALRERGLAVWFDREIPAGVRWDNAVNEALREADYILMLVSPNALESEWVQREINLAREMNKKIVPVLVSPNVSPSSLQEEFNMDARVTLDLTDNYSEAAKVIAKALSGNAEKES